MKKLLLLVFTGIALNTSAQSLGNELGIVVGPNLHYTLKDPDWTNYHAGMGFAAGITNNLSLGKRTSLYAAAMYEHRMLTQTQLPYIDLTPIADKAKHTEDIVTVPIMFRYTFGNAKVMPFVNAGPQIGFGFRRESTWYYNTMDPIGDPGHSINKNLDLSLSAAIGAGVKVNIIEHFSLSAEFRQSFWLLSDSEGSSTSVGDDFATPYGTSYLLIGAAYKFVKGK